VRAPGPCSRALRRHAPRASASVGPCEPAMPAGPKDGDVPRARCRALARHGQRRLHHCAVADARLASTAAASQTRTTGLVHRASPLGPSGRFACLSPQARAPDSRQSDVGLVPAFVGGPSRSMTESSAHSPPLPSSTRRSMPCTPWASRRLIVHHCPRARDARCHARRGRHGWRARSASTSTLQSELTFPRMLPAGSKGGASTGTVQSCAEATRATGLCLRGPGRASRARCRALTRHGQRRLHRCAVADATLATASATSPARTSGVVHRAAPLGPAGPSRAPHRKSASTRISTIRCRARPRVRWRSIPIDDRVVGS
jgi:hypothetical protein